MNAKSRTKINREPLKSTQELKEVKETPATPVQNRKGTLQDKVKQTPKGKSGEARVRSRSPISRFSPNRAQDTNEVNQY